MQVKVLLLVFSDSCTCAVCLRVPLSVTLVLMLRRCQCMSLIAQSFSVKAWIQGGVFEKDISAWGVA